MRKHNSTLVRLDTWDINFLLDALDAQSIEKRDLSFDLMATLSDALDRANDEETVDLEEYIEDLEETIFHLRGTIRRQNVNTSE